MRNSGSLLAFLICMEPVVGIFPTRSSATSAAMALRLRGLPPERIQLLLPGEAEGLEGLVPTDESEQTGVAKAIGGVTGGAIGASAGLGLAAAVASAVLPGVGAVTAIGLAAAAFLGAGGAVAGAAVGDALEDKTYRGVPRDELYLYEDALAHGRAILFATPETDDEAESLRRVLADNGAETLDAARESFWVGIRDAEQLHYEGSGAGEGSAPGSKFQTVEHAYRKGYVTGISGVASREPALEKDSEKDAYRRGLERGRARIAGPREPGASGS
jgi:hypothetical protein